MPGSTLSPVNDTTPASSPSPQTSSPQIDTWAAALARGEVVELRRSRLKSFLLVPVMLVIGLIGLAMVLTADFTGILIGGLLVLIGAASAIVLLRRGFARKPAAVISPDGITVRTGAGGPVPWSQITGIDAMRSAASTFVVLAVTEEARRSQAGGEFFGVELDATEPGDDSTDPGDVPTEPGDDSSEPEEDSQPLLWLPNGLAVDEGELVTWLERERIARSAAASPS